MNRRGLDALKTIFTMALILIVFGVLLFLFFKWVKPALTATECEKQGGVCRANCLGEEIATPFASECEGEKDFCCYDPAGKAAEEAKKNSDGTPVVIVQQPRMFLGYKEGGILTPGQNVLVNENAMPNLEFSTTLGRASGDAKFCETNVCTWKSSIVVEDQYHRPLPKDLFIATTKEKSGPLETILHEMITAYNGEKPPSPKTFNFDVKLSDKATEYVGQKIHLIITIEPEIDDPARKKTASYTFIVETPLKMSGATTKWERQKTLTFTCDESKGARCDSFVYHVRTGNATCSEDSIKTSTVAKPLVTTKVNWYITQRGKKMTQTAYATEAECLKAKDGGAQDYIPAIQAILTAAGQGPLSSSLATQYGALQTEANKLKCTQSTDIVDTTINPANVYAPDSFTKEGPVATAKFIINQQLVEDPHLCGYFIAKDTTTGTVQKYTFNKVPQKLYIDTIPPEATITFDALRLKILFECTDSGSGCKNNVGVAYISDVVSYLSALADRGQNADAWCPPPTSTRYVTELRTEVPYTSNEVRVLCMRATDNAGNTNLAIQTVYNGYDLLAKTIVLATEDG